MIGTQTVKRMLDVGREDADCVKCESEPGISPETRKPKSDRSHELADASESDHGRWVGNPVRRDRQERPGKCEMKATCKAVKDRYSDTASVPPLFYPCMILRRGQAMPFRRISSAALFVLSRWRPIDRRTPSVLLNWRSRYSMTSIRLPQGSRKSRNGPSRLPRPRVA